MFNSSFEEWERAFSVYEYFAARSGAAVLLFTFCGKPFFRMVVSLFFALLSVSTCDLLSLWIVVKCSDILRAVRCAGRRETGVVYADKRRPPALYGCGGHPYVPAKMGFYFIINAITSAIIIKTSANPLTHIPKVRAFDFFCAFAINIFIADMPPSMPIKT